MQGAVRATCRPAWCGTLYHNGKVVKVTGDTHTAVRLRRRSRTPYSSSREHPDRQRKRMTRAAATVIFYQLEITQGVC